MNPFCKAQLLLTHLPVLALADSALTPSWPFLHGLVQMPTAPGSLPLLPLPPQQHQTHNYALIPAHISLTVPVLEVPGGRAQVYLISTVMVKCRDMVAGYV